MTITTALTYAISLHVGDMDSDGQLDVVAVGLSSGISVVWFENLQCQVGLSHLGRGLQFAWCPLVIALFPHVTSPPPS